MPNTHQTALQADLKPKAIVMLLAKESYKTICEKLGIDPKTFYLWRQQDPDFKKTYDAYLDTCVDTSNVMVKELVEDIYDTLHDLLKKGSEMARLGAAKELINQLNKLTSKISPTNAIILKSPESDRVARILEVTKVLSDLFDTASDSDREKVIEITASKQTYSKLVSSGGNGNNSNEVNQTPPPESLQKQGY